jgi:hypothetical protein
MRVSRQARDARQWSDESRPAYSNTTIYQPLAFLSLKRTKFSLDFHRRSTIQDVNTGPIARDNPHRRHYECLFIAQKQRFTADIRFFYSPDLFFCVDSRDRTLRQSRHAVLGGPPSRRAVAGAAWFNGGRDR